MGEAVRQFRSPLIGTVVSVNAQPGDQVREGTEVVVLESMKMEHPVVADCDGTVSDIAVKEIGRAHV